MRISNMPKKNIRKMIEILKQIYWNTWILNLHFHFTFLNMPKPGYIGFTGYEQKILLSWLLNSGYLISEEEWMIMFLWIGGEIGFSSFLSIYEFMCYKNDKCSSCLFSKGLKLVSAFLNMNS